MKISETTKQFTLLFGIAFPLVITPLMVVGGGWEAFWPALLLHGACGGCAFLAGCLHDWLASKNRR